MKDDMNTPHSQDVNDEVLVLYYYADGLSDAERKAVAKALTGDPALAQRYQALSADLDAMRDPADAPMPEGLEYRLQSALSRAARVEAAERDSPSRRPHSWFHRWSFVAGAGAAAVFAVAVGVALWMTTGQNGDSPGIVQPPAGGAVEWSTAAFQRGLESHFRSGRQELAGIRGGGDRAALVTSLIEQNRLYARLAAQNDAPDLARVLRSFEPVLERLGQEDLSPDDAAALQAQLEFEFTVMLTKLARTTSQKANPDNLEMSL